MKTVLLLSYLLFIAPCMANSELDNLLDKIDEVYRSKSSYAEMSMEIATPHWQRILKMKSWTEGLKKTFITILEPKKEKGISTLKVENEMWNYFPKINKVIKVPSSMMMGSWMGSDFTNDDLVKENTLREDYFYKIIKKEKNIYTIELKPKPETVTVWGKIHLVVDAKKFIPLLEEFYDEKDVLKRKMVFDKVAKIQNNLIPLRMTLIPLDKEGHKTIIMYDKIRFDIPVKAETFSMKNLQKRR